MKPTKQIVYLPTNSKEVKRYSKHVIDCEECEGLIDDEQYTCTYCWSEGGNGKFYFDDLFKENEGYFFTPEQLNEYTANVVKQALETAAEKGICYINGFIQHSDGRQETQCFLDKQSIKNTFEETYKKFEV